MILKAAVAEFFFACFDMQTTWEENQAREVFRGKGNETCNLLWNASESKMDYWVDRGMDRYVDTW